MKNSLIRNFSRITFMVTAILAVFLSFPASGQDVKQVLEKVNKVYSSASSLKTQLAYRFYNAPSDKKFTLEQRVEYVTSGNNYFYKMDKMEQLYNGKYQVYVNHEYEVIGITEPETTGKKGDYNNMLFHPDSALKQCTKYTYAKSPDNRTEYCSFYFDQSLGFSKIDFHVTAATGHVQKIIIYLSGYDEEGENLSGSRVEIEVLKTEMNFTVPAGLFSESRYFTIVNKLYKLTPTYKNYTLLSSNP